MDSADVYPDALGDALSHSSQRLAQLGSLITAAATMQIRRRAQATAANAARSQQDLRALQKQQRAAWQLARAGWAPAHDARWLAQADLLQAARVWGTAAAHADADPAAASAARKCEERLRGLHPYAMAWYDRLRGEGAGAFEAMRQAVPLFGLAPHARPGDPGAHRRALEAPAGLDDALPDCSPARSADIASTHLSRERTAAQLAAESFPGTAADAVLAASNPGTHTGRSKTHIETSRRIPPSGRS
jgi:hypothetical protein